MKEDELTGGGEFGEVTGGNTVKEKRINGGQEQQKKRIR